MKPANWPFPWGHGPDFQPTLRGVNMKQREEFNAKRDQFSYPPIPDSELFFTGWGYEKPAIVHGWDWSTTFNKWGALVTFDNGTRVFTYPKTY